MLGFMFGSTKLHMQFASLECMQDWDHRANSLYFSNCSYQCYDP